MAENQVVVPRAEGLQIPPTDRRYRKLIQGTCGWSDTTLVQCGHFYPKKTLTAQEKLSFYSNQGGFGCVEVDTSTYAIPSPLTIDSWVQATPKDFIFHFKVFGFLINKGIQFNNIPKAIKEQLVDKFPSQDISNKYITYEMLGPDLLKELWGIYNNALLPAFNANKLGIVVFQFQNNFLPGEASYEHIRYCCDNLDPRYTMAIEFRNRVWVSDEVYKKTITFLKTLRGGTVALICCDDLLHELTQRDADAAVPAKDIRHCPIIIDLLACSKYVYVRVHRRFGEHRVLGDDEIDNWGKRFANLLQLKTEDLTYSNKDLAELNIVPTVSSQVSATSVSSNSIPDGTPTATQNSESDTVDYALKGPVYFLWGTDWQDQPMTNANKLYNVVPPHFNLSEKKIHCRDNNKYNIKNMFTMMSKSPTKTTSAVNSPAGSVSSTMTAEAKKANAINAMFDSPVKSTLTSPVKSPAVIPIGNANSSSSSAADATSSGADAVSSPQPKKRPLDFSSSSPAPSTPAKKKVEQTPTPGKQSITNFFTKK